MIETEVEVVEGTRKYIMCVRCVPVRAGSAYMRNAVNYLCAQYHHFLYMLSAWFGIGVKVPYVHWSIYQESKQTKNEKNQQLHIYTNNLQIAFA